MGPFINPHRVASSMVLILGFFPLSKTKHTSLQMVRIRCFNPQKGDEVEVGDKKMMIANKLNAF